MLCSFFTAIIAGAELIKILVVITLLIAVVAAVIAAVPAFVLAVVFSTFVDAVGTAGIVTVFAGVVILILILACRVKVADFLIRVLGVVLTEELIQYLQGFCYPHRANHLWYVCGDISQAGIAILGYVRMGMFGIRMFINSLNPDIAFGVYFDFVAA